MSEIVWETNSVLVYCAAFENLVAHIFLTVFRELIIYSAELR